MVKNRTLPDIRSKTSRVDFWDFLSSETVQWDTWGLRPGRKSKEKSVLSINPLSLVTSDVRISGTLQKEEEKKRENDDSIQILLKWRIFPFHSHLFPSRSSSQSKFSEANPAPFRNRKHFIVQMNSFLLLTLFLTGRFSLSHSTDTMKLATIILTIEGIRRGEDGIW